MSTEIAEDETPTLCACGCGGVPNVAAKTDARYGHVRGQRMRFLPGHQVVRQTPPQSEYRDIPIRAIRTLPQVRTTFDAEALAELAASIREHGVIQPLIVRPGDPADGGEPWVLVAGERRLRAAADGGLESVPCRVMELTDEAAAKLQLLENLQRCDLDAIEEAEGYERLIRDHGARAVDLARELGVSESHISNRRRLLRLPEEVRTEIARGNLPAATAMPLIALAPWPELAHTVADHLELVRVSAKGAPTAVHSWLCGHMPPVEGSDYRVQELRCDHASCPCRMATPGGWQQCEAVCLEPQRLDRLESDARAAGIPSAREARAERERWERLAEQARAEAQRGGTAAETSTEERPAPASAPDGGTEEHSDPDPHSRVLAHGEDPWRQHLRLVAEREAALRQGLDGLVAATLDDPTVGAGGWPLVALALLQSDIDDLDALGGALRPLGVAMPDEVLPDGEQEEWLVRTVRGLCVEDARALALRTAARTLDGLLARPLLGEEPEPVEPEPAEVLADVAPGVEWRERNGAWEGRVGTYIACLIRPLGAWQYTVRKPSQRIGDHGGAVPGGLRGNALEAVRRARQLSEQDAALPVPVPVPAPEPADDDDEAAAEEEHGDTDEPADQIDAALAALRALPAHRTDLDDLDAVRGWVGRWPAFDLAAQIAACGEYWLEHDTREQRTRGEFWPAPQWRRRVTAWMRRVSGQLRAEADAADAQTATVE